MRIRVCTFLTSPSLRLHHEGGVGWAATLTYPLPLPSVAFRQHPSTLASTVVSRCLLCWLVLSRSAGSWAEKRQTIKALTIKANKASTQTRSRVGAYRLAPPLFFVSTLSFLRSSIIRLLCRRLRCRRLRRFVGIAKKMPRYTRRLKKKKNSCHVRVIFKFRWHT